MLQNYFQSLISDDVCTQIWTELSINMKMTAGFSSKKSFKIKFTFFFTWLKNNSFPNPNLCKTRPFTSKVKFPMYKLFPCISTLLVSVKRIEKDLFVSAEKHFSCHMNYKWHFHKEWFNINISFPFRMKCSTQKIVWICILMRKIWLI